MKLKNLVVIIENKSGTCYQVGLTEEESLTVGRLISQMHNGSIKVCKEKLFLTLEKTTP